MPVPFSPCFVSVTRIPVDIIFLRSPLQANDYQAIRESIFPVLNIDDSVPRQDGWSLTTPQATRTEPPCPPGKPQQSV